MAQALSAFKQIEEAFDTKKGPSFLSCAENRHYLALGCNSMAHRGPTVFGMLLAFSGCTPEHSLEIVNHIWGQNGVSDETRLTLIQEGATHGKTRPESREHFRELFSD